MLYEEVEKYARLSGDKNALDTPTSRIGGYLDGYDKGIEVLEKIRAEIEEKADGSVGEIADGLYDALEIIDKYKAESEVIENGNDD